jgi:hypothetical protein
MSSNLPVLWVPPVTPPDPDERPPKRRGNLGVILAAAVIVGLPLGAWAMWTRTSTAPADAAAQAKIAETETVSPPAPTPAAKAEPAPSTSGGNLPYIARPTPTTAPAPTPAPTPSAASEPSPTPATAASAEAPAPLGPDGRPVRVIGIDKRTGDMTDPAATAPPTRVAEPEKPAPAAPSAAVEPAAPRGSIVETAPSQPSAPQPPVAVAPQPAAPEKPAVAVQEPTAPVAAPPVAAPPVEASRPTVLAPRAETKQAEPKPKPALPKREAVRTPSRDEDIPRADGGGDFADRLATIRREESRRVIERPRYVPQPEDDDEEVVVVPGPRWGWQPPAIFDDRPRGPVLRSFERPSREAASRDPVGENCHYHAWPTEDMAFHRQVQCHWHRDPRDPSLRYVR